MRPPDRLTLPLGIILLTALFLITLSLDFRTPDEDAYISYVYSQSLINGRGLTYHGFRVEGYTNPLTVLGAAALSRVTGVPIPNAGFLLSAGAFLVSIALFFAILHAEFRRFAGPIGASLGAATAAALLLMNPFVLYWGFSGMENSLLAALALLALLAWRRNADRCFLVCLAIIPLVRYDAIVLSVTWCGLRFVLRLWNSLPLPRGSPLRPLIRRELLAAALVVSPFALSIVGRIAYYGDAVPNTAYVKFLDRDPATRLIEGALYFWNNLLASKSLFFLAAITVLVVHRVQRLTSTTILALAGALVSGLHMVFVGGDVAWKPYFRFGYIFNLLILLAYFLTTWSRRAALNVVAVVIAALLIGFVHTDEVPAVGTYWTSLPFRTVYLRPSYAVTALGRLPSIAQQASQGSRDLYDDFPEDVLAATGKLLRLVAAPDDLLITTCAGKVVYYSRLTAIDVSNLANRDWRTYDRARRQALAREARYVVFNSNDRGIDDHLRPHTSKRLVAAVHSHFMYPGLYLFVFADTTLSNPPSSIGDRWSYTRHHLPFAGDHIDYYTDELRGSQDIEALLSAYRRLTGSLAPRQSPGPAAAGR